jgi:hypothetical protein
VRLIERVFEELRQALPQLMDVLFAEKVILT